MNSKKYNIAISSIGSGVGQSVINSLRLSNLPLKTVGFGNNPFAYGAFDCDETDYLPSIYAEDYVDLLIEKCNKHKIDLVIPGIDDEVLILAKNINKLNAKGIKVICAKEEFISICRDKERMSRELNKIVDVFVKSYNRESIYEDIESGKVSLPFIIKPKGGSASAGVSIINNMNDLSKISDQDVIQELAIPKQDDPNYEHYMDQISKNINPQVSEISIQVVFSQNGQLLGKMFSFNKLKNGIPIEIVPYENGHVWEIVDKLIPVFVDMGLKGPLNIQGRITDAGLKLFEMNPRFTGITGLRALMGFNEVEACVKEWLGIDSGQNKLVFNYNRFGIRQTADKSIPVERNDEILNFHKKLNNSIIKTRKTILITGSGGYLGQSLVNKLLASNEYELLVFGSNKPQVKNLFGGRLKDIYTEEDLIRGTLKLGNVDILVHCGFEEFNDTHDQIADSLRFTNKLFSEAAQNQIPAIINLSSQDVYGVGAPPLSTEQTPVAPETANAQAKYATELMLESAHAICNTLHYSSVRIGNLAGITSGNVKQDVLTEFCNNAIIGKPIKIVSGKQQIEYIDVRDAVDALMAMLKTDSVHWKPVYNLSSGEIFTMKDLAEKVVDIASDYGKSKKSKIEIGDNDITIKFGMDSTPFYRDMNWKIQCSIEDTIGSVISYLKNKPAG